MRKMFTNHFVNNEEGLKGRWIQEPGSFVLLLPNRAHNLPTFLAFLFCLFLRCQQRV